MAAENVKWREYRNANCALYGETEGGSDGWKNAWTGSCTLSETDKRIDETQKRIAALKRHLR